MISQPNGGDDGVWLAPVVDIWVNDSTDGQSVFVVGERSDGQRFFGSFWQPSLDDHDSESS